MILLLECNEEALDFPAKALAAQFPVRVQKMLVGKLVAACRRTLAVRWGAAVTSCFHLPEVERRLGGSGVPVLALLAEAHLETLHRLAQLTPGTRVGVASADPESAHTLQHSIACAGLPNIRLLGASAAEGAALGRLVRQVEVMVCSTLVAERVRGLAGPRVEVIVDDRALDRPAIEMLTDILVRPDAGRSLATGNPPRGGWGVGPPPRIPSTQGATEGAGQGR